MQKAKRESDGLLEIPSLNSSYSEYSVYSTQTGSDDDHDDDATSRGSHRDDDSVSLGLKRVSTIFTTTVSFWLISYILIMVQLWDGGHFIRYTVEFFIPMWVGSIFGFVSVILTMVKICDQGVQLVSRERMLFMRAEGRNIPGDDQYIDFESLPLMRTLFLWTSVLSASIVVCFITQILFYFWFILGIIGMWHALIPIIVLISFSLAYLYVAKTITVRDTCTLSILFATVLLFVAKLRHDGAVNIFVITIPLAVVQVSWLIDLLRTCYRAIVKTIDLSVTQWLSLFGFMIAFGLTLVTDSVTSFADNTLSSDVTINANPQRRQEILNIISWLISGILFILSFLVTTHVELHRIANSRGYCEPVPLARTRMGWEALPSRVERSLLLGAVRVNPPSLSMVRWSTPESALGASSFSTPVESLAIEQRERVRRSTRNHPNLERKVSGEFVA